MEAFRASSRARRLTIHGREYPEGLVDLRRLTEGSGTREVVVFGLADGEEEADVESRQIFAELRVELESAQQRLQTRLRELTGKLERLGAKQAALGIQGCYQKT